MEDWEFDRDTEGLLLPWPPEQRGRIERGEVNPTTQELGQWREAKRQRAVERGSGDCWIAWVVPLRIEENVAGYALFVCGSDGYPDEAPELAGVFDRIEDAEAALR